MKRSNDKILLNRKSFLKSLLIFVFTLALKFDKNIDSKTCYLSLNNSFFQVPVQVVTFNFMHDERTYLQDFKHLNILNGKCTRIMEK